MIQGAHTLDLVVAVLGPLDDVSALATIQFPEVEIGDDSARQARSVPDHIFTQSRIGGGMALAVEVAGGRRPEAVTFRMEVTGTDGDLSLDGGAIRGFQSGRLRLSLNGESERVEEGESGSMPDEAANVADMYAALRDDILSGSTTAPDFRHAVRLSRLIEDVMSSAQMGARKAAADWPMQS